MSLFPAFLKLANRRVLVVGGGSMAAQKIPGLLEAGARVHVVSPELHPSTAATNGKSPALAQRLRKELEQQFGPEWEEWVAQLGRTREELQSIPMPPEQRKRLLHQYASLDPKPH